MVERVARNASLVGQAMAYPAPSTKTFVLRARRETVTLVATVTAATFALSFAIHSHRPANRPDAPPLQAWTGELADIKATEFVPSDAAPITSASLVVPKSQFALPDSRVRALVRLHGCDGSLCTSRTAATPPPPRRPVVSGIEITAQAFRPVTHREKPSLIARLNPLNHLPDASTLKRPFVVAGDTVTGWFKRF